MGMPVVLDAGCSEPCKAVLINGCLPRKKFFDTECIAGTRFFKREKTTPHGSHHNSFSPRNPSVRSGRRQVSDGEWAAVRPNGIFCSAVGVTIIHQS